MIRPFPAAVLLTFFLGFSISPARAAFDAGAAREAFEQGLASKNAGQLGEAESYFKKAVQEEPSNADYHFELANVFALEYDGALHARDRLKAKEALASASRAFEQASMIRPDFVAAHFNLGVVYKKQQRYEDARNEFKKGMELTASEQPGTPFLMQIASIYEEQGFYDEAEVIYKEALEKDYGNSEIRNALETLGERRQWAAQRERQQQVSQMQNHWQELSAANTQQSSGNGNGLSSLAQQPGVAQLIPSLGSWLMQQMMSRRSASENMNS